MASPSSQGEDDLVAKLRAADPEELERKQHAVIERMNASARRQQERLEALFLENSSLPTTISSVTVDGAPNTRTSFLKGVVQPLLKENRTRPFAQSEAFREAAAVGDKLMKFGTFSGVTLSARLTKCRRLQRCYHVYRCT